MLLLYVVYKHVMGRSPLNHLQEFKEGRKKFTILYLASYPRVQVLSTCKFYWTVFQQGFVQAVAHRASHFWVLIQLALYCLFLYYECVKLKVDFCISCIIKCYKAWLFLLQTFWELCWESTNSWCAQGKSLVVLTITLPGSK